MLATAVIGFSLAYFAGLPSASTYAGERLFDQAEIIVLILLALLIEAMIWLL